MTNYGNGYKFQAIMERRMSNNTIRVQYMTKKGTWSKPYATKMYGATTPEDRVNELSRLNNCEYRIAE